MERASYVDDDGKVNRTGTWLTAGAHIITAVIGSGVLSLAWAMAQLGWVNGPIILLSFSFITLLTSFFLADSYRSPDPVTGQRNYTYMGAVTAVLGKEYEKYCGMAQYTNIIGTSIGYAITTSISCVAVLKAICFHKNGHEYNCNRSALPYMAAFGLVQIITSQIPNFHKLSWLSVVAALMSFTYSSIGLGLSLVKVLTGRSHVRTTLTGVEIGVDVTAQEKMWRAFQAIGDIAFAYSFSVVLIEIQDTLKSHPSENKVMKKATMLGVSTTTVFYVLCGCVGYAALGNDAPGNFLTGFGFYEPYWLICIANICIVVHLIGAYQVFCQPLFNFVENRYKDRYPNSEFITKDYPVTVPFYGTCEFNMFRVVWRTVYVIFTIIVAMVFPFFNDVLGLIGAVTYWPLAVYFPVKMYTTRNNLRSFSLSWIGLQFLTWICFGVSVLATIGSMEGLVTSVWKYKIFNMH